MTDHPRPRISLDLLRGFEAAARHLSFTRAAAELFVTQSAVSRQVKTLEEQLGKELFRRSNRNLSLTEAGLSLQQAVAQAQDLLDGALDRVRPQPRSANLVVAVAEPFASLVLAPGLARLPLAGTLRELRLVASNDPDEQARVQAHVLVRHYRKGAAPGGAIELAPDLVTPVCAPALLQRGERLSRPDDLAHHVLLRYEAVIERRTRVDWVRWLSAQGLSGMRPQTWVHFNRYDQVVAAAVSGFGVALGRLPLLAGHVRDGLLALPLEDCVVRTGSWYASIEAGPRERGTAEAFVAQLQALLAAPAPGLRPYRGGASAPPRR